MTTEAAFGPPGSVEEVWCDDGNRFEVYFDAGGRVVCGRQADDVIAATAALQADRERLESIPGVGAVTAQALLAERWRQAGPPGAEASAENGRRGDRDTPPIRGLGAS
jgi:hypothetical protein